MSGYDHLAPALAGCGRDGFTGALCVAGTPGGTVHFRNGLVVAAESPGAPGPEALLLRSGRISAEQWAALLAESGGANWPVAALVAHGYAGDATLRVVCVMALHDAVFAIAAGRVEDWRRTLDDTDPFAPVAVGEPTDRLVQDTARRIAAVRALDHPVHPDRERPLPTAEPDGPLTPLQSDLLTHADGRSTARDLAFRTGRSVYTVTVEVARMLADGLLECSPEPRPVRIRTPPEGVRRRVPRIPEPPPEPPLAPPPTPTALPRREPGASGIADVLAPERSAAGWKWFFRLRNGAARGSGGTV
ncbi:MarR family transcriptional regulator [Streptomyces cinnabarinus]|uniref:MarR family transcriptional regulator n=1 Tax=Streptomyces cinnabarinus TaxID=67287 RepID=A0ABY7KJL2_9ACTN|nr:helix-turn-helix domain-containing protein [Streptomyces cinnabarinus]WAZ23860.1 MarR family transcriptional regulator [Streptomyces cinnabarinus]